MKRKAKAEDTQQERNNREKHSPILCVKCGKDFETVEERANHIRTSRKHFCCRKCDDTVEFKDFPSLCLHYRCHHPLLHCRRCNLRFTTAEELNNHIKTSPRHFCCQQCDGAVQFRDTYNLRLHYKKCHPLTYCQICDEHFAASYELHAHTEECHTRCNSCQRRFSNPDQLNAHRKICKKTNKPRSHYATLGISPHSSHEQILKAAKEMRVRTHPDRLKRGRGLTEAQEMKIDAEAALVGQAADILSDPELRAKYDENLLV